MVLNHVIVIRGEGGTAAESLRHAEPCCDGVSNTSSHQIQILDEATEPHVFPTCHAAIAPFELTIVDLVPRLVSADNLLR